MCLTITEMRSMARVKNNFIYKNKHGVEFTLKEAQRVLKTLKTYNAKVEKNYNKYLRMGLSEETARSLSGDTVGIGLDAFRSKSSIKNTVDALMRRTTTKYQVDARFKLTETITRILWERLGLTPSQLNNLTEALNRMSMVEYYKWWEANKDLVEQILITSDRLGLSAEGYFNEDYADYIIKKLAASLRITL